MIIKHKTNIHDNEINEAYSEKLFSASIIVPKKVFFLNVMIKKWYNVIIFYLK